VALGVLLNFHFAILNIFQFLVSTAKLLAISITIGEALQIVFCALPILSFSLCCAKTICPAVHTPPIGEV
jgi:hypothetical protein